ncbi:hypothetical protein [Loktanella atrilutea]|uniref:hypothetical protein n=1 Tax=Loktanella atrilutea TaxID=366533 RepID=UPI0015B61D0A|nr:hypothetical protein [Loktanella atrilutea]
MTPDPSVRAAKLREIVIRRMEIALSDPDNGVGRFNHFGTRPNNKTDLWEETA